MAVTFKSSCIVKPSGQPWQGVMSLSMFDQTGSITHEPTAYLYRRPSNEWLSPPDAVADALKKSLSRALEHFYPLAGRVRWSKEGKGRLELHCNAMGAEFVEAGVDSELDQLSLKNRHLIPDYEKKYKSLPYEEIPLLMVQLTRFACGGISLGLALSQAVADGMASGHFLSEWARLARNEPLKMAPFLDRGVMRAGEPSRVSISMDLEAYSFSKLIKPKRSDHHEEEDEIIKLDQYSTARLRLGKEQVEKVKKMANEGREDGRPITRPYTRYEALTAHMWRSVSKARRHVFPEQPTTLMIPVDSRGRVNPPLPWNYFGNAVCEVLANSVAGELISQPLRFAASIIREKIEGTNNEFIWNSVESLKSVSDLTCMQNLESHLSENPAIMNPNLSVISWLTLPIYGLDFGWGKNFYMGPGDIEGEFLYLLPCPSADGSVLVEFRLHNAYIKSFEEHCFNDIV